MALQKTTVLLLGQHEANLKLLYCIHKKNLVFTTALVGDTMHHVEKIFWNTVLQGNEKNRL